LNGSQNQPQVLSVTDSFASGDVVKVKALALICDLGAVATLANSVKDPAPAPGTPPLPDPDPTKGEAAVVACYTVGGADGERHVANVVTALTEVNAVNGQEHVALGAIQLLCTPGVLKP
jgi:hypothetical protein